MAHFVIDFLLKLRTQYLGYTSLGPNEIHDTEVI